MRVDSPDCLAIGNGKAQHAIFRSHQKRRRSRCCNFASIEKLWRRLPSERAQGDKLDILSTLVEKYEDDRWPNIDASDPIDLLNYAIDELGHSQAELADLLGSRSRASELLNRRRALTVEMIYKISEAWKISADLLVRPSRAAA